MQSGMFILALHLENILNTPKNPNLGLLLPLPSSHSSLVMAFKKEKELDLGLGTIL
jgi:hypothetical protein